MSSFFKDLEWRGLVYQATDDNLAEWLAKQPRSVYAGFDPTADSLHVGSLMPLLMLRRFKAAGHRPIALVGGATGMIGDPSGKSNERNLLDETQLHTNLAGIERQIRQVLAGIDGPDPIIVNNADWMGKFGYIEFLRDVGKNFPVNVMMAKDSVKSRLEGDAGISYTEFSYMLLQAYDFVHLAQTYDCALQLGGSDQWGNITAGIDLARRMFGSQLQGMTHPLLTKSDGSKMGKTESGAIWLDPDRTSPYQFYQYWVNVADEDAGKCLRLLTELDREEIESLDASRQREPEKNDSQRRLAEAMTRMIHGQAGLAAAQQATEIFFGAEIRDLHDAALGQIFSDVNSVEITQSDFASGIPLIDAFVKTGLGKSKGDVRRTIAQGGGYVNNRRIQELDYQLTPDDLASETMIVLRSGKKRYALIRIVA